jgi:hypothetical protein
MKSIDNETYDKISELLGTKMNDVWIHKIQSLRFKVANPGLVKSLEPQIIKRLETENKALLKEVEDLRITVKTMMKVSR